MWDISKGDESGDETVGRVLRWGGEGDREDEAEEMLLEDESERWRGMS